MLGTRMKVTEAQNTAAANNHGMSFRRAEPPAPGTFPAVPRLLRGTHARVLPFGLH